MKKRKLSEISSESVEPEENHLSRELLESFKCIICHADACFCPWLFPCSEHMACYSCIKQYANNQIVNNLQYDGTVKNTKLEFETIGNLTCPLCKKHSIACDLKSDKYSYGHIWTTQLRPVPISTILIIEEAFRQKQERDKKYPCPNVECKYESTHVRMARHISEGVRNCVKCIDGLSSENLFDAKIYASKKFRAVTTLQNPESRDWCVHISTECKWCQKLYPIVEDGHFIHLYDTCKSMNCVGSKSCQFQGTLQEIQEHLKMHEKLEQFISKFQIMFEEIKDMDLSIVESKNLGVIEKSVHCVVGEFLKHYVGKSGQPSGKILTPMLLKILHEHLVLNQTIN